MVVEVDAQGIPDPTSYLAPCPLPLIRPSSLSGPSHAGLGTWEEARSVRGSGGRGLRSCCHLGTQVINTFHAEPGTMGDAVEADAVCMVRGIAAIAEEEKVFLVRSVADRAWCVIQLFLLWILV